MIFIKIACCKQIGLNDFNNILSSIGTNESNNTAINLNFDGSYYEIDEDWAISNKGQDDDFVIRFENITNSKIKNVLDIDFIHTGSIHFKMAIIINELIDNFDAYIITGGLDIRGLDQFPPDRVIKYI